jgi:hypothetical protein
MWERLAGAVRAPAQYAQPWRASLTQPQTGRTTLQADLTALPTNQHTASHQYIEAMQNHLHINNAIPYKMFHAGAA